MSNSTFSRPISRYVVFHKPGPGWENGVDFRQQPGVAAHVAHYQELHSQGKLALGGPFLAPDSGGMMVTTTGISLEEIAAFAEADPAVQSGMLIYEIKPWYTAMEG